MTAALVTQVSFPTHSYDVRYVEFEQGSSYNVDLS